jgi:hypothetical protein
MTVRLRRENCCENPGCTRPRHIGSLCAQCFQGATAARRSVELLAHRAASEEKQPTEPIDSLAVALCVELEAIFELPAVEPKGWAA